MIFFKKLTLEPSLTSPTVGPGPTSLPSCCSEIKCYRSDDWYSWVEMKVDGPTRWKWPVQTPKSGRSKTTESERSTKVHFPSQDRPLFPDSYSPKCRHFLKLTGRFFKIVKEGVHISVHSSSITAKLPVISSNSDHLTQIIWVRCLYKVGCVFQMVIWPEFRMGKCRDDDHKEDAPNFDLRFLLFVEFIDQWICELEVSFLHLWSQSICNLVTEGISGENELLANIVIWLNEKNITFEGQNMEFLE